MMNLELFALAINETIGVKDFCVYLNSNVFPDDVGNRNVVTMTVLRVPYGFTTDELDAETLNVTLTFDLPCDVFGEQYVVRGTALNVIESKLLGRNTFVVAGVDGETSYVVNTFFEQQPPAPPYADSGRITQQIVVSGQALVQNSACKAMVGNDVTVSIATEKDGAYTQLLKTTRASTLQIGVDNNIPLSKNSTLPEATGVSRTHTKSLTLLYKGAEIENEFLMIAEGYPHDVNKIYYYKVEYGTAFALIVPFKLLGVTTQDSAGVYLQYTLNIQTVEDAEEQPIAT